MTGSVDAHQQQQESVRRRILTATLDVIAADGLDAVRHRRVAEMAGVSLGSTTYHFASRDDLIEAAFELYLELATAFLDQLGPPPSDHMDVVGDMDVADDIVDYLVRVLTDEFSDAGAVQAEYELILYAARNPRVAERLMAWEAIQRSQLEVMLRAAGAPNPSAAARSLLALVRGLEIERLTSGRPLPDLRRRLEPIVRALSMP